MALLSSRTIGLVPQPPFLSIRTNWYPGRRWVTKCNNFLRMSSVVLIYAHGCNLPEVSSCPLMMLLSMVISGTLSATGFSGCNGLILAALCPWTLYASTNRASPWSGEKAHSLLQWQTFWTSKQYSSTIYSCFRTIIACTFIYTRFRKWIPPTL